jgi:hypothetical protein
VITDAILGGLLTVARAILGLIPEWGPDVSAVSGSGETIGQTAAAGNGWFPVATLAAVLALIWGYRIVLMVWRLITRGYELLPFKFS